MNPKLEALRLALETPGQAEHEMAKRAAKPADSPAVAHQGLLGKLAHAVGGKLFDMHKAYKEGAAAAAADWQKPEYRTADDEPVKVRGAPAGHPHPHMWNAGYGLTMGAFHDRG